MSKDDKLLYVRESFGETYHDYEINAKEGKEIKRCIKKSQHLKTKNNFFFLSPFVIFNFISEFLSNLLLPKGYPDSVCPEYIQFQFWDTSQEACGYFRGILVNQAYLQTLGVGNPEVTVFSAIVLTMIIDYAKMVSGLFIGGSTKLIQTFAMNQKFYSMLKEIICFFENLMTLSSVMFPDNVLLILLVRNIIGACAVVMDGACHSTLITHIARKNNFSDCNAKEGNQSRMLKFLIIGLGYRFLIFINEDGQRAFIAFIVLSFSRLFCKYKAMKTLKLRTLSPKRLEMCIEAWYNKRHNNMSIPSIADQEAILYPQTAAINSAGTTLANLTCGAAHLSKIIKIHTKVNHVLVVSTTSTDPHILLKVEADDQNILQAYVHAFLYKIKQKMIGPSSDVQYEKNIKESLEIMMNDISANIEKLKSFGWEIDNLTLLPSENFRIKIM